MFNSNQQCQGSTMQKFLFIGVVNHIILHVITMYHLVCMYFHKDNYLPSCSYNKSMR